MRLTKFGSIVILSLGVLVGVSVSVGTMVFADRKAQPDNIPLQDLRTFTEVLDRVKQEYVEPVDDKTLLHNAIRGMLSGLDPHSSYLDVNEYKEMQINTSGKFGGLGIEVQMEDGFIKVVAPIDDTPAAKAGLQPGDIIVRIDEHQVKGMSLNDAVELMRGEPGSKIQLTILRTGKDTPFVVTLTRDIINVVSVKSRLLEPGFGYIRLTQFRSDAAKDLRDQLDKLRKQNKGSLKGLVMDLRNNPGGLLTAAVEVSDAFLDRGLIVYTQGRDSSDRQDFNATPGELLQRAPMVILVNGGTASASEIVAGALQDNHRAVIMGTQTFGKGSVQTILPLPGGDAIKLTTARYYTPSGRSIQAQGIQPDISLQPLKVSAAKDDDVISVREADLVGRLAPSEQEKKNKDNSKDEEDLVKSDYQLYEALNLLKGLNLTLARR
jgi:carboxyl-terminal processing protease